MDGIMPRIDFETAKSKVLSDLSGRSVMVLATSANDSVTARSMSTVLCDGDIFFQTDKNMEKSRQMRANGNVALCVDGYEIQGIASEAGTWNDNPRALAEYLKKHRSSFERYAALPAEVVFRVRITRIKKWEYAGDRPFIEEIDFTSGCATVEEYPV